LGTSFLSFCQKSAKRDFQQEIGQNFKSTENHGQVSPRTLGHKPSPNWNKEEDSSPPPPPFVANWLANFGWVRGMHFAKCQQPQPTISTGDGDTFLQCLPMLCPQLNWSGPIFVRPVGPTAAHAHCPLSWAFLAAYCLPLFVGQTANLFNGKHHFVHLSISCLTCQSDFIDQSCTMHATFPRAIPSSSLRQ
jgi:hypothetical protein